MNYLQIKQGQYELCFGGKTMRLEFLSNRCFRLYQRTPNRRYYAIESEPISEADVCQSESGLEFGYSQIKVAFDEENRLSVSYFGQESFRAEPYKVSHETENLSLMAMEGHHASRDLNGKGGIRIYADLPIYGMGERSGPLDKRGYDYVNWNTDDPSAHVDTFKSLYQSMPFFIAFRGKTSFGVFLDNTSKSHFDFNKSKRDSILIDFEDGVADYYFFFGSMPEVIQEFTRLTGRNPLVPYWALGAQQCRWSYHDKAELDAVIEGYAKANIPLSAVYLDIDYMDAYKDFTVDASKFPHIQDYLAELRKKDIYVVPIIDAGVKAEEGYFLYDEGVKNGYFSTLDGEIYHNEVWPGDSVFPAFLDEPVQQWWANHIQHMLELGFAGIWNDMNEPASFKGPLPMDVMMGKDMPHRVAHNIYGHHMVKAGAMGFEKAGKRLFQLTRAGYAGTCRYSATWAGDNQSIYDHLRLMLPQLMNMSLSGQAYIGVDIGGFGGDTTPELLTKWAIAAILNPLYRNHSAMGTLPQEPYTLNGDYLLGYRKAVMTRYEILPTLYDELYFAESEGSVPLRPLIYNFPDDSNVLNENTEMMLGESLLVAPSLFPGETKRVCYFPDDFVQFGTWKHYAKGHHIIDVGLTDTPLFLRENGMVVLASSGNDKAKKNGVLRVFLGKDGSSARHFEDDGGGLGYRNGQYNLYHLRNEGGVLKISYLHHGMQSEYQKVILVHLDGKETTMDFVDLILPA